MHQNRERLQILIETALLATLALILDLFVPSFSPAFKISIKMLPIIILALRRGLIPGLAGGLLWGLLQIIVGEADILGFSQALIEYILAFAAIGLAGLLSPALKKLLKKPDYAPYLAGALALAATFLGSFCRYFFHFIAGIVFWGQYAPEGVSPALNSFLVNGGAFLSETLTCAVVILLMLPLYPKLFLTKEPKSDQLV